MNARKAKKHMQRATELMNQSQLGFGVNEQQNSTVLGKRPRDEEKDEKESEYVEGFSTQIGKTCFMNAVFNVMMRCIWTDRIFFKTHEKLIWFLRWKYTSNESIFVGPPLKDKGVRSPSSMHLQQSRTRNLFGPNFNRTYFQLHNALYGGKKGLNERHSVHDRIDWEDREFVFINGTALFLFTLILLAHSKLTYVHTFKSKPDGDDDVFLIDNISLENKSPDNREVIVKRKKVSSRKQLTQELQHEKYLYSYIFCKQKHHDGPSKDKILACFLNHQWLMEKLRGRFKGSIVRLGPLPDIKNCKGHAVMAYIQDLLPFDPKKPEILVCDSNYSYCTKSSDFWTRRRIVENIFIYIPWPIID